MLHLQIKSDFQSLTVVPTIDKWGVVPLFLGTVVHTLVLGGFVHARFRARVSLALMRLGFLGDL